MRYSFVFMNESPEENGQDVSRKFWGTILSLMEELFPLDEEILFVKEKHQEYGGSGFIMSCLRSYIDQRYWLLLKRSV